MRYFITFACYGAHLHGDGSGSVDRRNNLPGARLLDKDTQRSSREHQSMHQAPYLLNPESRTAVLQALQEVCSYRGWTLLAAHVRTNHVHVIVKSDTPPEKIMNDFKAYASRRLNQVEQSGRKRWAHHGSTRYLWKDQEVRDAIRYVVDEQGEAMAMYVAEEY